MDVSVTEPVPSSITYDTCRRMKKRHGIKQDKTQKKDKA